MRTNMTDLELGKLSISGGRMDANEHDRFRVRQTLH